MWISEASRSIASETIISTSSLISSPRAESIEAALTLVREAKLTNPSAAWLEAALLLDKAGLEPRIAALPDIDFRKESAFGLDPMDLPPIAWLLCDVACYPERLLQLITTWIESHRCLRIVATVKLQGTWEPAQTAALAAVPGSGLLHLFHNKHELTFFWNASRL